MFSRRIILSAVFIFIAAFSAATQTRDVKVWSITDYFKNLPEKYKTFDGDFHPASEETTVVDEQNGYAAYLNLPPQPEAGNQPFPISEMAPFKSQTKPPLLVVSNTKSDPVCTDYETFFLRRVSDKWTACFPGTQAEKFTGNHVLYVADLPPRSVMTVTVKPKNDSTNLSIYGYQIGVEKVILPEDSQYSVTCEADHKRDYLRRGESPTSTRTMRFNAIGNSYKVVIGVAGSGNLTEGDFTLEITLKQ